MRESGEQDADNVPVIKLVSGRQSQPLDKRYHTAADRESTCFGNFHGQPVVVQLHYLGATGIDSLPKVRVSMPGVDGISRPEQIVKTITGEYNYAMAA